MSDLTVMKDNINPWFLRPPRLRQNNWVSGSRCTTYQYSRTPDYLEYKCSFFMMGSRQVFFECREMVWHDWRDH